MPDTTEKRETGPRPGRIETFLGGSPGRVIIRLILMSLFVGFVMSVMGISPQAIFGSIERFFNSIFDNGFELLRSSFSYVLTGAVLVIPLWFIGRLLAAGRKR